MRQQFADAAIGLVWQAGEDILQVEEGIVAIELGGLDQAHDRRGALAGAQAAGK